MGRQSLPATFEVQMPFPAAASRRVDAGVSVRMPLIWVFLFPKTRVPTVMASEGPEAVSTAWLKLVRGQRELSAFTSVSETQIVVRRPSIGCSGYVKHHLQPRLLCRHCSVFSAAEPASVIGSLH